MTPTYAELRKTVYNPVGHFKDPENYIGAIRLTLQYGFGEKGRMDFVIKFTDGEYKEKHTWCTSFYSDFFGDYNKIDVYNKVKKLIGEAVEFTYGENPDTFLALPENKWLIKGFDARNFEKERYVLYDEHRRPI